MAKQVEQSLPILDELEKQGTDSEGVDKVYAKWAEEYDKDMVTLNYTEPSVGATEMENCLKDNKDALILDAACGTGLGGIEVMIVSVCLSQ
ncbi:methyltransferase-like protein 27 [Lingula anatina]|uniref:Methyltransferase-like protein 27 n=1 Tax=Lingula anatina TaxID=7574 RepID=A0A1S3JZ04_LINAN|nr:methyltransferase-like protein 27 [Lingula anatina]|eukprot:XP_013415532.1 methyltransferase-like protein 27 [Lingula anatina]